MSNDETTHVENTLYVVYNEEGDMTADTDRDTALERMNDEYGGNVYRVIEMTVKVPRPVDVKASMTLPDVAPEPVEIEVQS